MSKKNKHDGASRGVDVHVLRAQLEQCEKMAALGLLVAGVAHEINTPIGALKSNHDLAVRCLKKIRAILADTELNEHEELNKLLDSLGGLEEVNATAMERIVKIVKSLRTFARLDDTDRVDLNLHDVIDNTLTLVHHKLKNRIAVHRDYGELPVLQGFPHRLGQVFLNILVNACQAIEEKGEIHVSTREENGSAVIEIRDSGKGIPADILPRIFEPGFTTKEAGTGTGLGLSIVTQIVEDHNGKISIDSEVGRGTTVRIELPIR